MAEDRLRHDGIRVDPAIVDCFAACKAIWYETPEEIEAGLEWGREKERLFRLIRREMRRRLTKRERRCLELYFFKGLTFREAAKATSTHPSSVHRAVQRGLRKLRHAAKSGGLTSCAFARKQTQPRRT